MRIALWHNLPSGGGKRALFDQVRGLLENGHHVEAWCPPSADREFLPIDHLVSEHVVPLPPEIPAPSFPFQALRTRARASRTRIAQLTRHCEDCAAEIGRGQFDVLLAHPCRFLRTSPIAQFVDLPSVLYLQEPFRELYEAWPRLGWVGEDRPFRLLSRACWVAQARDLADLHSQRVQARIERQWAGSFDRILVNSLFSRESLLRAYNVDSQVCYLGIDTASFTPGSGRKKNFVVGLGNFYFNKRPLLAIHAVGAIPAATRPKLVWVGNFVDRTLLAQAQADANRLQVDFELRTLIPDRELHALLGEAAAMIYTSHLEPFGYAPLEANACGTVVVAVAEGGVRETVTPANGVLIPSANPFELGAALAKFTGDLPLASSAGVAARRYVEENWSLPRARAALESHLRGAIAETQSPADAPPGFRL